MYLRPYYSKNAPGPPQILPQIQDGGQKSNMADKMHKIIPILEIEFQIAIGLSLHLQWVIRSTSCLVLMWGFRGRWIEWCYFRFDQIQNGGRRPFWKFQVAIFRQRVIRSTSCLILGWGFWGWRIEWRYFRSAHIQHCGRPPSKIWLCAMVQPIPYV